MTINLFSENTKKRILNLFTSVFLLYLYISCNEGINTEINGHIIVGMEKWQKMNGKEITGREGLKYISSLLKSF